MIGDCIVDDVPDHALNRLMSGSDDINVELTMKDAIRMFNKKGADIPEAYSRPRIAQAAAEYDKDGITLQSGWSLDMTVADPTTGKALDFAHPKVQSHVLKLLDSTRPLFSVGSPPCTAFYPLQNLSRRSRETQC